MWERLFGVHAFYATVLLVLPALVARALAEPIELLRDPDLWWHLADARLLFQKLHFIHFETFSFSVAGKPWVNPEWLSEVPFWVAYRAFHFSGIYLVTWLALVANLLFVYWRSHRRAQHPSAAFWASGLSFFLMSVNSGPRTILLAYLALSAELALLEEYEEHRGRSLWLLPPLFCVWINLHGSWFIGIAILALYTVCGFFHFSAGAMVQRARSGTQQKELLGVLAASIAALLINPYGWRLIWNPLDMMLNQKLNIGNVLEWQPLNLGTPLGKIAVIAVVVMLLANLCRPRTWNFYQVLVITFAWYAAFAHARFCFLAAVITTPFLASDLARSFLSSNSTTKTIPALNAVLLSVAVGGMCFLFPRNAQLQADYEKLFPHHLIAQADPSWRTFNQANLGGVMAFESRSSFIDSRLDIFEHEGILAAYLDAMTVHKPFELLEREHIDHVLVSAQAPLGYVLQHSSAWREVGREGSGPETYVLWARK